MSSRTLSIILALVAILMAVAGCGLLGGSTEGGESSTLRPSPEPATAAPAAQPRPATPTPRPAPTAIVAPQPAVTQQQAEAVVRAWFEALGSEDYERAQSLTAGEAARQTRQLADTIQREASERGVTADIAIQRLELNPAQSPVDSAQAVRADFTIDVGGVAGPFTFPGQTLEGAATFLVQQVEGEAKITDIRDVSGLPSL